MSFRQERNAIKLAERSPLSSTSGSLDLGAVPASPGGPPGPRAAQELPSRLSLEGQQRSASPM